MGKKRQASRVLGVPTAVWDAPCLFSSPFFQFATSTAISTGLSGPFGASAPGRRGYRSLDLVEMQGRSRGEV